MLNIFKYLNEVEEKRKVRLREHTKILNDEVYRKLSYICIEPMAVTVGKDNSRFL